MLMKWEDLEVGDVIRYRDEVYEFFKNSNLEWARLWCNRDLEIKKIQINKSSIKITTQVSTVPICMKSDGSNWFFYHHDLLPGGLFKIIKLKED